MNRIRFQYENSNVSVIREYDTLPDIGSEVGVLSKSQGVSRILQLHKIDSIVPSDEPDVDYLATTKYIGERVL